jgi:hypothetical protein
MIRWEHERRNESFAGDRGTSATNPKRWWQGSVEGEVTVRRIKDKGRTPKYIGEGRVRRRTIRLDPRAYHVSS